MRLQQGISLLEVLLAVLLLKVSVLGALAGQLHARQMVTEATQRTQAVAMAADWLNRMQASGTSLSDSSPPPHCTEATPCAPDTLSAWLQQQWHQQWWQTNTALAQGGYCTEPQASGAELVVYWHSRHLLGGSSDASPCNVSIPTMSLQVRAAL